MFYQNRFTERAQKALTLAQEAAGSFGHSYIGSEMCIRDRSPCQVCSFRHQVFGGAGGIRTHAPFRTNGFQDRPVMTTSIPLRSFAR